jgi:transposase-like protein
MAKGNTSRFGDSVGEGAMLDDPDFLRDIVERTVQQILEAEMTAQRPEGTRRRAV